MIASVRPVEYVGARAAATAGRLRLVAGPDVTLSTPESNIEYVNVLSFNSVRHELHRPLRLEVEPSDDGVMVLSALLGVSGIGIDLSAAIEDLADTAWRMWVEFRDEPIDSLHPSAQRARARLSRIFGE